MIASQDLRAVTKITFLKQRQQEQKSKSCPDGLPLKTQTKAVNCTSKPSPFCSTSEPIQPAFCGVRQPAFCGDMVAQICSSIAFMPAFFRSLCFSRLLPFQLLGRRLYGSGSFRRQQQQPDLNAAKSPMTSLHTLLFLVPRLRGRVQLQVILQSNNLDLTPASSFIKLRFTRSWQDGETPWPT